MGMTLEHTSGYTMESGYMTDAMKNLCPDGEKWEANGCWVVLMKEGIMTQAGINKFFQSIPSEHTGDPFLFVLNPNFNPNTLRILIDTLIENKFNFQFIFVNEAKMDDVYMDCAAVTGGTVQDASTGVGEYEFKYCGKADHVCVEQEKSLFNFTHNPEVQVRIDSYREKLEKKRYKLNQVDRVMYERRLGSLTNGIVKIKVGVPTVTEYKIIQLKLDDAIGAVRKAFKYGIVLGGGRALLNVSTQMSNMCWITEALRKPSEVICNNAGVDTNWRASAERTVGMDVTRNKLVDLRAAGILDSYLSIDEALKNASSIACAYLRTNTLMQKETTNK
jgi:chaperonin GroEL (HSP60 family)